MAALRHQLDSTATYPSFLVHQRCTEGHSIMLCRLSASPSASTGTKEAPCCSAMRTNPACGKVEVIGGQD